MAQIRIDAGNVPVVAVSFSRTVMASIYLMI